MLSANNNNVVLTAINTQNLTSTIYSNASTITTPSGERMTSTTTDAANSLLPAAATTAVITPNLKNTQNASTKRHRSSSSTTSGSPAIQPTFATLSSSTTAIITATNLPMISNSSLSTTIASTYKGHNGIFCTNKRSLGTSSSKIGRTRTTAITNTIVTGNKVDSSNKVRDTLQQYTTVQQDPAHRRIIGRSTGFSRQNKGHVTAFTTSAPCSTTQSQQANNFEPTSSIATMIPTCAQPQQAPITGIEKTQEPHWIDIPYFDPEEHGLETDFRLSRFCDLECIKPQFYTFKWDLESAHNVISIRHQHTNLLLTQACRQTLALIDYPVLLGHIACVNLLNEFYAIGLSKCVSIMFNLNIPRRMPEKERDVVLPLILEGFKACADEVGAELGRGYTIVDSWLSVGGIISGICDSKDYIAIDKSVAGDVLVLTKPLGTHIALNAFQWLEESSKWNRIKLVVTDDDIRKAYLRSIDVMCRLNRTAARLMHKYQAHAAIDVNEAGLLVKAQRLAEKQKHPISFVIHNMPVIAKMAVVAKACSQTFPLISGYCPETSGGLLICMARDRAAEFCKEFEQLEGYSAWIIGIVEKGERSARIIEKPRIIEVPAKDHENELW